MSFSPGRSIAEPSIHSLGPSSSSSSFSASNAKSMGLYERSELIITPPFPHDASTSSTILFAKDHDNDDEREKPIKNPISKLVEVLRNIMPGSDITRLQVPIKFNIPKTYLQCYGESVYCCGQDLLGACSDTSTTSLQRFLHVVAWTLSTFRLYPFGVAPLNPTLGETHHVSSPHFNVLLEQVSHHPPISALYATNEARKIRLQWTRQIQPHFYGNKMEAEVCGASTLWLDLHNEVYTYTNPRIQVRFFPAPGNEFVSTSTVKCVSSGLEATIAFKTKTCFGLRGTLGQVMGQVWDVHSKCLLYEISGAWNRVVTLKNMKTGEMSILFDAMASLSNMKAPVFRNETDELAQTESVVIWKGAMGGITGRDWEMGRRSKHEVEERQRAVAKQRKKEGIVWAPKHFVEADDGNWQWLHKGKPVPPSPLVVPS